MNDSNPADHINAALHNVNATLGLHGATLNAHNTALLYHLRSHRRKLTVFVVVSTLAMFMSAAALGIVMANNHLLKNQKESIPISAPDEITAQTPLRPVRQVDVAEVESPGLCPGIWLFPDQRPTETIFLLERCSLHRQFHPTSPS